MTVKPCKQLHYQFEISRIYPISTIEASPRHAILSYRLCAHKPLRAC